MEHKILLGYNAIVTGGARGIGAAIVEELTGAGASVAFCDTARESGEELARRTGAVFSQLDVCHTELLTGWYGLCSERMGGVDIVINNVGISEFRSINEIEVEEFDRVIATNLRPAFILSREFAKATREYGRIVNIASTRHLQSEAGSEAYAAAKGGLVSLTHALAVSLSGHGNTTVNCVSPGWIDTLHYEISPEDHALHPSGRVGVVADVSRMVLFLCDPRNGFINGQDHIVDGGMTKKMVY